MLKRRDGSGWATSIGLSQRTMLAASSYVIPGRRPTTSITGPPATTGVAILAGQLTLPRASSATCSALAGPVEAAGAGVPDPADDPGLASFDPHAARATSAMTPTASLKSRI